MLCIFKTTHTLIFLFETRMQGRIDLEITMRKLGKSLNGSRPKRLIILSKSSHEYCGRVYDFMFQTSCEDFYQVLFLLIG